MSKIFRPADPTEVVARIGEYGECKACGSRGTEDPCWCCGGKVRYVTTPVLAGGEQTAYFNRNSRWFRSG